MKRKGIRNTLDLTRTRNWLLKRLYRAILLNEIITNCENDDELLSCLKKIDMKEMIYWSAEAREAISESTLQKGWCKILNVEFIESNERENRPELPKYVKKIPVYRSMTADGVKKWATADNNIEELNYVDIAEIVLSGATNDKDESKKKNEKYHMMRYFLYWKNL